VRPGLPTAPWKLTWILTERCNLRCAACGVWRAPRPELSLDEVRSFLERSNDFSWVDLSGGEIFLRDELVEVFAAVLVRCRRLALLHFPTNGLLTSRIVEVTQEVLAMRPPRLVVTVSVDGPPQLHDELRGAAGSFERALETYARLRELRGCAVALGMTLSWCNVGRLDETFAAVRHALPDVTWRDLHVNVAQRSAHYYKNPELPAAPAERLLADLRAVRARRGVPRSPLDLVERRFLALAERFVATGRSPIACRALRATCFVAADGTVFPCVGWDRPVGALRDNGYDLASIWSSPAAQAARGAIAAGGCPGCWTACEAFPALAGSPSWLIR
jgi:MoaA/NifB/PqqE/SkfB family radical SAM enzyme